MRKEIKRDIENIKEASDKMVRVFEFNKGYRRIPTENEINTWAMIIDRAIMSDSKRVRAEALDMTGWMMEIVRRTFKELEEKEPPPEMDYGYADS